MSSSQLRTIVFWEELQELFEKSPSAEKLKSIKPDVNSTAGQPDVPPLFAAMGLKGVRFLQRPQGHINIK